MLLTKADLGSIFVPLGQMSFTTYHDIVALTELRHKLWVNRA
jgi:hypothetical protein